VPTGTSFPIEEAGYCRSLPVAGSTRWYRTLGGFWEGGDYGAPTIIGFTYVGFGEVEDGVSR
jgi:hypothetical protein